MEITESLKALFDSLMAELRLSGKDRNKSITTKAAKELIAIKEKTLGVPAEADETAQGAGVHHTGGREADEEDHGR